MLCQLVCECVCVPGCCCCHKATTLGQRLYLHRLACGVESVKGQKKSEKSANQSVLRWTGDSQGWGRSRQTLRGFWMVMSLFLTVVNACFIQFFL